MLLCWVHAKHGADISPLEMWSDYQVSKTDAVLAHENIHQHQSYFSRREQLV